MTRRAGEVLSLEDVGQAIASALGSGGSPVAAQDSPLAFVEKYRPIFDGVSLADGLAHDWRHLRPLYEDAHPKGVLMASAQSGKTALICTIALWVALGDAYGRLMGFYFPDKELPIKYGRDRIKPMVKSTPELAKLIGKPTADKKGTDNILTMSIGETMLYLLTIGGRTSTEGVPLKAVLFDEVRRMGIGDIERAMQRYSAQLNPRDYKVSTPGYPDSTIDHYFQQGDQRYFHTGCECPDGVVLPLRWPDCVADMRSATSVLKRKVAHLYSHAGIPLYGMRPEKLAEYPAATYVCPTCGKFLLDTRDGFWLPHNDGSYVHSWQFGKMVSPVSCAGEVLHKFETSTDRQEFFNSELGLPFLDEDRRPVKATHVDACVDKDLEWGERMSDDQRRRRMVNTGMGVDIQAGYAIAVVKQQQPTGKARTVHCEVVHVPRTTGEQRSFWHRLGVLMRRYDVRLCVVDEQPDYDGSLAFCNAFRGRVYLANYSLGENAPRMVAWDDAALGQDTKQLGELAIRWRVSIQRTKVLRWSLMQWVNRRNEIPNLDTLTQILPTQNGKVVFSPHLEVGAKDARHVAVARILQDHLTRFVFRDVLDTDDVPKKRSNRPLPKQEGKTKMIAEHIGSSPDFAHANLYADVALDRLGGNVL